MSFQPLWEIPELQGQAPAGEVLSFPECELDHETAPLGLVPELEPEPEPEPEPDSEALLARLQAAQEEGQEAGRAEAEEAFASEKEALERRVKILEQALAGLQLEGQAQAAQSAEQAVAIAVALSRRLLGDTLLHAPEALEALVLKTLARFPSGGRVRVHVPVDRVDSMAQLLARQEVEVLGDPGIEAGCRIEREGCEVDASLKALLTELDAAVATP